MKTLRSLLTAALLSGAVLAQAAPRLALVKSGTPAQASDSITLGTLTYNLDLRGDTDGNPISGWQYYFTTTPANALTFGGTPITVLNNPFTASDLSASPSAGATVNQAGGTTAWFTFNPDYAAFANNALATYQFNTSTLGLGTYVFTPVGEELVNSSDTITTFASPGTFSLDIVNVPEPGSAVLMALGGLALLMRRRPRGTA